MDTFCRRRLQNISDYLKEHHSRYRQVTVRRIYEAIRTLKDTPHRGKPGRVEGTREVLFPPMPYVAIYRVREETLEVLRIWHTAQHRP